jgi:hypothetical protein
MGDERTVVDLDRAARAISDCFATDTVFIIGSQAILVIRPDAPAVLRASGEIDAYPGNYLEWEGGDALRLASEEINGLFGSGSLFHQTHGFYIDGVDESTAKLPPGWRSRTNERTIKYNSKTIHIVAPCLEDLIVSKLYRLDPKDKDFVRGCHQMEALDIALIERRLAELSPPLEIANRAIGFLASL